MIRGVNRQVIVLKPDKSSAFETVYFMLKSDLKKASVLDKDMVREANKIISENYSEKVRRTDKKAKRLFTKAFPFIFGVILGVLLSSVIWIMLR